ncbi:MAG TPA: hypothetical protein VGL56_05325 [Fimbriimonadaceae bacterium]|jgi:hypothetical protein
MGRYLLGLLMIVCGLIGLNQAYELVTYDALLCFHFLFVDYPDPERPGHLKGVIVSTPEILLKTLVTAAFLGATVWIYRRLRKTKT